MMDVIAVLNNYTVICSVYKIDGCDCCSKPILYCNYYNQFYIVIII